MSSRQPIIKFSPFEALLIGEKNKVLKRQPMKNTIFVTRIYQKQKTINLRDLFDLEKDNTKPAANDVIFKVPQRVRDFLKSRRLKIKNCNKNPNKREDILFYEFEGERIILKKNSTLKLKGKKSKSNKVKFKKKFKFKKNIKEKVAKKFCSNSKKRNHCQSRCKKIPRLKLKDVRKRKYNGNRHLLRGTDGKFIRKNEYENSTEKETSTKEKTLSNYLEQFYVKKENICSHKDKLKSNENYNNKLPLKLEPIISIPRVDDIFDLYKSDLSVNECLKKYYDNCLEKFKFPSYPKNLVLSSNFENDVNLIDIIYENFPKSIKFGSKDLNKDFSETLKSSNILNYKNNVKMYEKRKNGVSVVFDNRVPYIQLKRINLSSINSDYRHINREKLGYNSIDEPFTKNDQLIHGKSIASLFFKSVEGKDIFVGNLFKPLLNNSWFGSLPGF